MDLPWIHIIGDINNPFLDLLFVDLFMPFMGTQRLRRKAPNIVLFFSFDFVIFIHL